MENEKTFTQEEVNQIVQERLERERARYNKDADNVQALQEQVARVTAELENTKAEYLEKERIRYDENLKTELLKKLEGNHIVSPDAIYPLFSNKATLNDQGELLLYGTNVDEYLKEWGDANPWAIKSLQKPGSGHKNLSQSHREIDEMERYRKAFNS